MHGEIENRLGQTKAAFQMTKSVLFNKSLPLDPAKRVKKHYIEPLLLYDGESLIVNRHIMESLK